ncbi:hypothetical protein BC830DRAFT_1100720 [Chytriomyces sp. MP71]|nr:hypothetical protein BC830DRAFT_1100720 [Chytriomyces sp. MP71]
MKSPSRPMLLHHHHQVHPKAPVSAAVTSVQSTVAAAAGASRGSHEAGNSSGQQFLPQQQQQQITDSSAIPSQNNNNNSNHASHHPGLMKSTLHSSHIPATPHPNTSHLLPQPIHIQPLSLPRSDSADSAISLASATSDASLLNYAFLPGSQAQLSKEDKSFLPSHQHPSHQMESTTNTPASHSILEGFPHEILARVFLMLPVPTRLAATCRRMHTHFYVDPFLPAHWLILHNQYLPVHACVSPIHSQPALHRKSQEEQLQLRPVTPVHPLLAAMKHESRVRLLEDKPWIAEMLLKIEPFVSRYELQRMYRRAITTCVSTTASAFIPMAIPGRFGYGLIHCTEVISQWSAMLLGEPVRVTVPIAKPIPHPPLPVLPLQALPALPNAIANGLNQMEVILEENEMDAVATATPLHMPTDPPVPTVVGTPRPLGRPPSALAGPTIVYPVDDRRVFLDAVVAGDTLTLQHMLVGCALSLDPRVVADGFARAWDRGDPHGLCVMRDGVLWPRCSASRFHVLEKLVQEEDEVVSVFLMQGGVGVAGVPENLDLGEEMVETVVGLLKNVWEILEEEVAECGSGKCAVEEEEDGMMDIVYSRSCDVLLAAGVLGDIASASSAAASVSSVPSLNSPGENGSPLDKVADKMEGLQYATAKDTVYKGFKAMYGNRLWSPSAPFLQRAFDAFVSFGSVRAVALLLYKYRKYVTVRPYHLTAALDRYSFPLVYLLVEYVGADFAWEEDARLSAYVKKPSDPSIVDGPVPSPTALDNAGRLCWSWALRRGRVQITARRWEGIVKLGPMTVGAVLESMTGSSEMTFMDPCRDSMIGFRLGGAHVVRVLSKAVDAFFSVEGGSKCVLFEAALGDDGRALDFCVTLAPILASALSNGERERVMELLDAGAIVTDEVLVAAACIADMPPGDWDEWPMAARCYRRVLVQKRLGLPIPSSKTLSLLPDTVVNTAFLHALFSTRPIFCDPVTANVYTLYQRRRHANAAGVRINLVPVLERDVSVRVMDNAMANLRGLLKVCDDPAYPGEAYCFIKGMLQFGLRDKNLLRDEDEFFLPDDEWDEVASALTSPGSI